MQCNTIRGGGGSEIHKCGQMQHFRVHTRIGAPGARTGLGSNRWELWYLFLMVTKIRLMMTRIRRIATTSPAMVMNSSSSLLGVVTFTGPCDVQACYSTGSVSTFIYT